MRTINFNVTEIKVTETNISSFKPAATEIKVMPFTNTPNILSRNCKANAYRVACKRKSSHEVHMYFILQIMSLWKDLGSILITIFDKKRLKQRQLLQSKGKEKKICQRQKDT